MKIERMNEGLPLPAGHAKAGQLGMLIDFEDGISEPQRVYAPDEKTMSDKLAANYGNTRNTVLQLRRKLPADPPPAAAPPPTPAAPAAPLTVDERMQLIADCDDPAKAGAAMAKLMAADAGFDIEEVKRDQKRRRDEDAEREYVAYQQGEIAKFMEACPDYVGTANNAQLLRNATFARVGARPKAEDWQKSYEELLEMNVLESAKEPDPSLATVPPEPSAPPAVPPRSSTGVRPSTLQRTPARVPAGPKMTRTQALDLALTDDYDRRIAQEPGFRAQIEAALSNPG